MSDELKPCPFCGSDEIEYKPTYSGGGESHGLMRCLECGCTVPTSEFGKHVKEPYSEWNRRAERTCRVEVERRKLSQTQTAIVKTCSGCGFEFGVEKENTLPFEVTLNVVVPPNYCPNCGARVIEEEL